MGSNGAREHATHMPSNVKGISGDQRTCTAENTTDHVMGMGFMLIVLSNGATADGCF